MPITIRALLTGRPAYVPHTPWGPIGALATVGLILLCPLLLPLFLYGLSADLFGPPIEIASIGLVWLAAGMRGGKRAKALSLNPVQGGANTQVVVTSLACAVLFLASYAFYEVFGKGIVARPPQLKAAQTEFMRFLPWIALVDLVVITPIYEEFLFRGFLLSALAQSKMGFWSAAILTNLLWVSMHAAHPWQALSVAFMVGMMLSFVLWRTGSLWTCVFTHGAYNTMPALFRLLVIGN